MLKRTWLKWVHATVIAVLKPDRNSVQGNVEWGQILWSRIIHLLLIMRDWDNTGRTNSSIDFRSFLYGHAAPDLFCQDARPMNVVILPISVFGIHQKVSNNKSKKVPVHSFSLIIVNRGKWLGSPPNITRSK